jgi:hypothetical protein
MADPMKLRIQGDAVRLRLNQTEVARFAETGLVEETLQIAPDAVFRFALESTAKAGALCAVYTDGALRIVVPGSEARDWVSTERVGIAGEQVVAAGSSLKILVEKDFQCLHGDAEPDSDAFPNPLENKGL